VKLGMFHNGATDRIGVALGDEHFIDLGLAVSALGGRELEFADTVGLLEAGDDAMARARAAVEAIEREAGLQVEPIVRRLDSVVLLSPVPRPHKFIGVGLNYKDHIAEQNAKVPSVPILFAKFATAIVGPYEEIEYPTFSEELDYEAELAVIIGRRARSVSVADALDYVAGYTVCNDVTARDVQLRDRQWLRGKTPDRSTPLGPWLVTPDEISDPGNLAIRLWVNDTLLQDSRTDQLLFGIAELISFTSECVTLEPGDVIATGTPGGVGFARTPPIFMKCGDVVRVHIEELGQLRNTVAPAAAAPQ
jgi:acylpyruvate hydrolase